MNGAGFDGDSIALVIFAAFLAVSVLLCGLAATDIDEAEQFYTGKGSLGPVQNGLAIAGDYISAATVLGTTGSIALAGYDGIMFACATVLSLVLLMLVMAEPLRSAGRYTLGDVLARRLRERPARIAMGTATVLVLFPLLLIQLTAAGKVMSALLGLSGGGALTACTVFTGTLMVCYAAFGGMRGTGLVQILKTVVVLAAIAVLAGMVLDRFDWSLGRLFDAAAEGNGSGDAYGKPGLQFGDSTAGRFDTFSFQLTLAVGAACMPHVTMRLYAARSARALRTSMTWAIGAVAALCAGVVVIGIGAAALVGSRVIHASDRSGDTALMLLSGALDPGAGTADNSLLFSFVACAVFATTLATVAGITLAAASTLAHDLLGRSALGGKLSVTREVTRARLAVVALGSVAVLLAVFTRDWNSEVLISYTFANAASALLPVLLYSLFWKGFTTTGMCWTLYGTLALVLILIAVSPGVSGSPVAIFPDWDFNLFPLQAPGIVTIPAGFAFGWLGSVFGGGRPEPEEKEWAAAQPPVADTGFRF
ncbi:cation acetate symporter [Streptomyces sp. NPDC004647]|uniref:sodium/solute symporter n=1 Tax=Streptomyces sp. NPDC004647 TaxID=3154671 RepID=UPI0033B2B63F